MKETEFIDIHKLDKSFEKKLKTIEKDKKLSDKNRSTILRYLRDSQLGKTIKTGQKRKIAAGRNLQAAGFLYLMANRWFKKDFEDVTMQDMEKFILNLDKGSIKSKYGKPYSSETKSNIKKFIRKFYKWLLADNKHYPDIVEWIDTSKKEAQINAIPDLKEGIEMITELIPDIRRKALIMVAFDSGFREGELLNCRIKDVEKDKDNVYYITCRHSKTKPRTVSLPYSSDLLERWLKQHPEKDNKDAQLWQTSRVMFYKTVKLYGKKAHKMNITVHMIRHTSATFYAPKLDRVTFCKRFGWSYNSPSPDRYIDFAKVTENKVVEIVRTEQYSEMKRELEDQKAKMALMQEENKKEMETQKAELLDYFKKEFKREILASIKAK